MLEAVIVSGRWRPIRATGVMRLSTLVREMARRDARRGRLTIRGGGQGLALADERTA